jgi:hypothetical protein
LVFIKPAYRKFSGVCGWSPNMGQQVQEQERAHRIPRALRQLLGEALPVFGDGDGDLPRDTLWHTMLLSVCPSSG